MKQVSLIISVFFLLGFALNTAQAQCPTEYLAENQAQLDSFKILYPNCTEMDGFMTIKYNVEDLNGLSNLTSIGELSLSFVGSLANFSGLENLETITNSFRIRLNHGITSFQGLENLKTIGGSFSSDNNMNISGYDALSSLESIGGQLKLLGGSDIPDFDGLENLKSVGSLYLSNNYKLTTLRGLDNLENINGSVDLIGNYIEDLDGLSNLTYLSGSLNISNNAFLNDIYGLGNVGEVGSGLITIKNNNSLSQCDIYPVCAALANDPSQVTIRNNAGGCSEITDFTDDCINNFGFNTVSGNVFADLDCNGVFDGEDGVVPNYVIQNTQTNMPWAHSSEDGEFYRLLYPNSTTSFGVNPPNGYDAVPTEIEITTTDTISTYYAGSLRLCPNDEFKDVEVWITTHFPPVPGFWTTYSISVRNKGTETADVSLRLDLFQNADNIQSFNNGLFEALGNDAWVMEMLDLRVFETRTADIKVKLDPLTTPLGEYLVMQAVAGVQNGTDVHIDDNTYYLEHLIVGSFDPNDKTVDKPHLDALEANKSHTLEYKIRFQNTGTFPAQFITVLDTLPVELDLSSLEMLEASHSYRLTFETPGVLNWHFADIQLPDSTSNEPESHGFIRFKIDTYADLPLDAQILNRAGIYFDFNAPVITEYAETTFQTTGVFDSNNQLSFLEIYPNPASDFILIKNLPTDVLSFQVFDVLGKKMVDLKANSTGQLDISRLSSGMYFLNVDGGRVGKFLVE